MEDKVINEIIQVAKICKEPQDFNIKGTTPKKEWKEIEKELKDKNIDVRTICMVSSIYSKEKNKEIDKE